MIRPYKERVAEFERRMIRRALRKTAGRKSDAAQLLGLTYRELRHKFKTLDMYESPGKLKPFS